MKDRNDLPNNNDRADNHADEQASNNRGGATDLTNEAVSGGRARNPNTGSGAITKNTVTGSDFDGQVSE